MKVLLVGAGGVGSAFVKIAARRDFIESLVVADIDGARAAKVAATKGYGGQVVVYDRYRDDREQIGRDLAARHGYTLIPPYDHADVIAGQGTAAQLKVDVMGLKISTAGPIDFRFGDGNRLSAANMNYDHASGTWVFHKVNLWISSTPGEE